MFHNYGGCAVYAFDVGQNLDVTDYVIHRQDRIIYLYRYIGSDTNITVPTKY